jgi:hypothetical protein
MATGTTLTLTLQPRGILVKVIATPTVDVAATVVFKAMIALTMAMGVT